MLHKIASAYITILALFTVQAFAQGNQPQNNRQSDQQNKQQSRQQSKAYQRSDDSWVTLNGRVLSAGNDSFVLDYGDGTITVEMDDWDWYEEGNLLSAGDRVSVSGLIDDDFLEKRSIEASTVYVEDLNTYFYASAADEEDPYFVSTTYYIQPLGDESQLSLTGTVGQVSGREFTLDTGTGSIQVDTSYMRYNPLDKQGFQRVSRGDKVSVSGELDLDFFEEREILADSVISLNQSSDRKQNRRSGQRQQQSSG